MKKFDSKTCIIVVSCDGYEDAWEPFFILKNKYWKNNYKTYLITESKKCSYCETINVNEKIWTKRLREALEKIDYKYVIFLLEDFFIREKVNQNMIEKYIKYFPSDGAVIHFVDGNNYVKSNILDLDVKKDIATYKCNCQCGIWDRKKLISLLAKDGSAWDWELTEPCVDGYKYYANQKREVINYGYGIYGFGIFHGKWNKRDVSKLFKKEGITVDLKKRGFSHDNKIIHDIKTFLYPMYRLLFKKENK